MTEPINWSITTEQSATSTSDLAKRAAANGAPSGQAFLAIEQTAGRGRHGRHWDSQKGGMYLSVLLRPGVPIDQWFALSFAASLAVLEAVRAQLATRLSPLEMPQTGLKWPNDLWIGDAKLAGILVEVQGDQDQTFVVVGFGLNLQQPVAVDSRVSAIDQVLDRAWTDTDSVGLIESVLSTICHYPATPAATRIARYLAVSVLEGRMVNVNGASEGFTGVAQGIDEFGRLCVLNENGVNSISAGDVSVRPEPCNI